MTIIKDCLNTQSIRIQMTGGRTVRKEFDDIIKGYILSLNGSPATSRVHLPKSDKKGR